MLPAKIRVGPMVYRVVEKKKLKRGKIFYSGLHWAHKQKIELDAKAPPHYKAAVLIHEILHAILESAGYKEDHPEDFINAVSYGMVDLIRQNPELIDYLQEEVAK